MDVTSACRRSGALVGSRATRTMIEPPRATPPNAALRVTPPKTPLTASMLTARRRPARRRKTPQKRRSGKLSGTWTQKRTSRRFGTLAGQNFLGTRNQTTQPGYEAKSRRVRPPAAQDRSASDVRQANRRLHNSALRESTENKCPAPISQPDPFRHHAILASGNQFFRTQPFGALPDTPSVYQRREFLSPHDCHAARRFDLCSPNFAIRRPDQSQPALPPVNGRI